MEFIGLLLFMLMLGIWLSMKEKKGFAHGYVEVPMSRAYRYAGPGWNPAQTLDWPTRQGIVGSATDNPHGLETRQGWPAMLGAEFGSDGTPRDGRIASANGVHGSPLIDRQTSTLWGKTHIEPGPNRFTWWYTIGHATRRWQYFITKRDWNPDAPLTRDQFDLTPIHTVEWDGSFFGVHGSRSNHMVNIPADRSGYHIVLAVWTIADTSMAFYNVVDLFIEGSGSVTPPPPPPPPAPTPPAAPTGLHAYYVTDRDVNLRWSSDGSAAHYEIFRGTASTNMARIGTATSREFVDGSVAPGTSYLYHVVAVGANGLSSSASIPISVSIASAPSRPEGLHVMGEVAPGNVDLMWTGVPNSVRYDISRGQDGVNFNVVGSAENARYVDTTATAGGTYYYKVNAYLSNGNRSEPSNILSVVIPGENICYCPCPCPPVTPPPPPVTPPPPPVPVPPMPPSNLRFEEVNPDSVRLSWNAVPEASMYTVYRGYNQNEMDVVKVTTSPTATDMHVTPGESYYYQVSATDAKGVQSEKSNAIYTTIPHQEPPIVEPPITVPPVEPEIPEVIPGEYLTPRNLRTVTKTTTSITFTWDPPYRASTVAAYEVFKNGVKIAEVPASIQTYTATGLTPDTSYTFTVRSHATSPHSNSVTATTSPAVSTVPEWSPTGVYQVGDIVLYNGRQYRAIQAHTANPWWNPTPNPSLWQPVN